VNDTVAANRAAGHTGGNGGATGSGVGGGFDLTAGSATSSNTILAMNTATTSGPDCAGTVSSSGHNLLGSNDGCSGFTAPGDQVNNDPLLGPLQNNGGPTQTMAIPVGSPAQDHGDAFVCSAAPVNGVDQRGVTRQSDPSCDVGAYEQTG